jgi:hypothetical protein
LTEHILPSTAEAKESSVTFTTKELLQRIDTRFDRLESLAEASASRVDLMIVTNRISALEQDASGTKAVAKALLESGKDRFSRNEKMAGLLFGVVALTPSVIAIINLFQP